MRAFYTLEDLKWDAFRRPTRYSRATLTINQLKGKPLTAVFPILNVHRCNPYGVDHGGQDSKVRHVGDLGNIVTDARGCSKYRFSDPMIKLRGTKSNIIGRGLIIHADEDDCGEGGDAASLANGNAGKRIACAVIGYRSTKKS